MHQNSRREAAAGVGGLWGSECPSVEVVIDVGASLKLLGGFGCLPSS